MSNPIVQCSNPDCRVADTNKCVEGLSTSECQNFGKEPLLIDSDDSDSPDADVVALTPASRLSLDQAALVLRRDEGRVIAIVGPHDAGKTSLIAGLYDQLQVGPIASSYFNGSQTLHALEMSCHDARAASERNVPHINRTPLGEVEFFHIGLTDMPSGERITLLIGDRAGEDYKSAADDVQIVASFDEIQRADTLTFLVDGQRLTQNVTRHQVRSELLRVVQALVDGGGTSLRQRVAVVLTKLDEVRTSPNADRALSDFASDVSKLCQLFGSRFSSIVPFHVAASPKHVAVPRGEGLRELLQHWILPTSIAEGDFPQQAAQERVYRRMREE